MGVPRIFLDLLDRCANWHPKTVEEVLQIEITDVLGAGHANGDGSEVAVVRDANGRVWALPGLGVAGMPGYENLRRGMRLRLTLRKTITVRTKVAVMPLEPAELPASEEMEVMDRVA